MAVLAEYIWIDGTQPTASLRAKTRVITDPSVPFSTTFVDVDDIPMSFFPDWGADGSSTNQAGGDDSDIVLKPVSAIRDPYRPGGYLVLCEVFSGDESIHPSNHRSELRRVLDAGAGNTEPLFGFEQEYTYLKLDGTPFGFPDGGEPTPQRSILLCRWIWEYCWSRSLRRFSASGIESRSFHHRNQLGSHARSGRGTSVRWSSEGFGSHLVCPLASPSFSEKYDIVISLDAKPAKGDWNGAGMHTNFSTKLMREHDGIKAIHSACEKIGNKINEHLAVYGDDYESRLTGAHETCSYKEFRYGAS